MIGGVQIEISHTGDEKVGLTKFANPQSTLTVEDEGPLPAGLANGL